MTSLVFGTATPSIYNAAEPLLLPIVAQRGKAISSGGKNCGAGRNGGLAQSNTSDDTLPTVLDGVNNCVCEDLWRMFCIKETKRQCVVQWQEAQPAK